MLTCISLVFCNWLAYSFLQSSHCWDLMVELILCFSTSARDKLRSASAFWYKSKARSEAPNAFSYFSFVLLNWTRDVWSWDWIRAPSVKCWKNKKSLVKIRYIIWFDYIENVHAKMTICEECQKKMILDYFQLHFYIAKKHCALWS